MDGNIVVNINSRPNISEFSLLLIQYNYANKTNVSDSQLKVVSNYNKNNCDTQKSTLNNQQNTLSVSLQFGIGKNCERNIGLIIGLVVGIPLFMVVLTIIIISVIHFYSKKNLENFMERQNTETKKIKSDSHFIVNKKFEEITKWKTKEDIEMKQKNYDNI